MALSRSTPSVRRTECTPPLLFSFDLAIFGIGKEDLLCAGLDEKPEFRPRHGHCPVRGKSCRMHDLGMEAGSGATEQEARERKTSPGYGTILVSHFSDFTSSPTLSLPRSTSVYTSVVQSLFRRKIRKLWTRMFSSAGMDERRISGCGAITDRVTANHAGCMI